MRCFGFPFLYVVIMRDRSFGSHGFMLQFIDFFFFFF